MEEFDENSKKSRLKNTILNNGYKATHYRSYHAYRRSQRIARTLLGAGVLFALFGLIPFPVIQGTVLNIALFLILFYILFDYWTSSKASQMRKDSKFVVDQASAMSGVKSINEGWHIYDGGYATDNGQETLEISFVKERSFLGNVYELRLKNQLLFLDTKDSVTSLRYFLLQQKENNGYAVYGTVDGKYVKYLRERGIILTELPNKFRNKPNRFDYAAATGKFKNAFSKYPKDFEAYTFTVDISREKQRLIDEAKQEKIRKKGNKTLINLKKLK